MGKNLFFQVSRDLKEPSKLIRDDRHLVVSIELKGESIQKVMNLSFKDRREDNLHERELSLVEQSIALKLELMSMSLVQQVREISEEDSSVSSLSSNTSHSSNGDFSKHDSEALNKISVLV